MIKTKNLKIFLISIAVFFVSGMFNFVFAAGAFSGFLVKLYKFGLSAAFFLALLMIVISGVQYVISGASVDKKSEAMSRIKSALFGLLLALCTWLILYTINPDLIKNGLSLIPITGYVDKSSNPTWFNCFLTMKDGTIQKSNGASTQSGCNTLCQQIVQVNSALVTSGVCQQQ